jgi:putative intracellular protease/amidase
MPTEPQVPTLAELVRRAGEVVDPDGAEPAVTELVQRFEDRDEPVTAVAHVGQELEEAREALDPGPDEAAVTVAAAVATYLAFRRDEADGDRETLLRLAARAEFQPEPEPAVAQWLEQHGVPVA